MSHLHTPISARGSSRLDDPKYLFSAEAREAIKRHPSMTPVPLFHHPHHPHHNHPATNHSTNSQLVSPSALSNTTSLSSSTQPLDHRSLASSASYMSTALIRPQPRSPHDTEAWENSSTALTAHSPFQQTYGGYTHYQQSHLPVLPSTLSSTSLPPSPSSAIRPTAPFFASLAKHSSLSLTSPSPTRAYLPAAVSVYGQFDSAVWQRTPLPKSLSTHPMAVAQSEARRQREEWERESKRLWELERERDELLRRSEERQRLQQQEMHIRAMQAQDDAAQQEQQQQHTPLVVKRGNAAAIGSRPSHSIRRSAQSAEAGFVTPAAKPRRRPESTYEVKKGRVQTVPVEKEREERKEAGAADRSEEEGQRQDEASSEEDGLVGHEDDQAADYDERIQAVEEEETGESERTADSDTEDEEDGAAHDMEVEREESAVQLSPVKKRSSNRIYSAPATSASTSSSTSASPTAIPLPPPPPGLKPDMSLSRWYFHIQQHNPPLPPRVVIKGTHSTEGAWSSGYVIDRERTTGRVLLTNSRRYVLQDEMDDGEMEREGWSERMRRACVDGLPVEWKDWLVREAEQLLQQQQDREAKRVSFDFAEEREDDDTTGKPREQEEGKNEEEEEEEEEEQPTSHRRLSPLIRARRSPAPIRHTEWWEDEVMRLVEAVSMHTTDNDNHNSPLTVGSDTVDVWKRVADEVGGGRRWEECRRKFDEVRREQSRGMKESEKKKEKVKRVEERKEERRVVHEKMEKGSDRVVGRKQQLEKAEKDEENSGAGAASHKATKRSLIPSAPPAVASSVRNTREKKAAVSRERVEDKRAKRNKQHKQQKVTEVKDDEKTNTDGDEEVAVGQFYATTAPDGTLGRAASHQPSNAPQPPHTTAASKKRTATSAVKPAATPRTPSTAATASVEHAVLNPHDVAYTHTRRSGRAVMAPLRHWELEREVNGVILRGFQHGGEAIRRVLTEKERMEKEKGTSLHTVQPPQLAVTKRRVGGEKRVRARSWSVDEREQLRLAYMWVDPSERGFWLSVSRFMADRTADECQTEYEKMYPTPKRRGKRKDKDEREDDDQQTGEEGKTSEVAGKAEAEADESEQGKKRRKRMTTIKREIRTALDSRQLQHNGDDLFDSTPYKHNAHLTHTAPQPPLNTRRTATHSSQPSSGAEEAEGSLLFAGDAALADMQVQRVVKERRRVRVNKGKVVEVERRRQGREEERSKRGERLVEGANELRLGVRRLEADEEERKQELMDEMDDEEDEIVDD